MLSTGFNFSPSSSYLTGSTIRFDNLLYNNIITYDSGVSVPFVNFGYTGVQFGYDECFKFKDDSPDYEKIYEVYLANNKDKSIKDCFIDALKIAWTMGRLKND